jgi:pyruvate formate lyase activating enzyme
MRNVPAMDAGRLVLAAGVAYARGLRYVYVGNVGGAAGELENTRCPSCASTLVERRNYAVIESRMNAGCCGSCGTSIPGRWC